jgi:hypothetical protein
MSTPHAMPKTKPVTHSVTPGFPGTAHISHPEALPVAAPRKRTTVRKAATLVK